MDAVVDDQGKNRHAIESLISELEKLREMISFRILELNDLETERRKLEESLKYSEAKNRAILDTAVDAIITISERGVIEIFNGAAERLFGYKAYEVVGQTVNMLMPEPHATHHDEYLHNYLTTGIKKIIGIGREVIGKHKNGTLFPMELAVSEVGYGEARTFTGIIRDITHRKKMEEEKADFYAMMAHDIKSPLTSILGYAELLLVGDKFKLDDNAKEAALIIEKSGEKLLSIVEEFLTLSRLQSDKINLNKSTVDVCGLLKEVYDEMEPQVRRKGLEFSLALPQEPIAAIFDKSLIKLAVVNLVQNAANYTSSGSVTIGADITDGQSGDLRSALAISVSDTGSGIPDEHIGHIFNRYYRAPEAMDLKGSGLGLAIVKAAVDIHGGRVETDCPVGIGCTFRVLLPLPKKKELAGEL